MNINEIVFTTYSFGPLYVFQQRRLRESILKVYPNANLRFWNDKDGASSPQPGRPEGSKTFHESMYGFKVHCIKNCIEEGFKKIIFLDAAIILEGEIDKIMERAEQYGVLCAIDPSGLENYISDRCLEYAGYTREKIQERKLTLVGGSVYIFDFNNPVAQDVFDYWAKMEEDGIFGSEEEDARGNLQGHRKDETCLALALDTCGLRPLSFDMVGYHNLGCRNSDARFTFYKLHFKGIGKVQDHSLNQSIIPLHGNILDLGCRDFVFTKFFRDLEYNTHSVDIGTFDGEYDRVAISDKDGICFVQNERDPDATHITSEDTGVPINMMTLNTYSKSIGVDHWDLIKMDIEGAEYGILKSAAHPIASQITVEFHAHCGQHKKDLDALLNDLEQYYHIHNRDWCEEHSAGFNYWDILLISKEWLSGT